MAGHSQFKNIMHRKGAQDKKRSKTFTKIIRELTVAARINMDPHSNPCLRAAMTLARMANMPKDVIDRAIKRAAGTQGDNQYINMTYEGYGPAGAAVIVETLTDNKNRTVGAIRSIFSKYGGNLGETNSVAFQFSHVGLIYFAPDKVAFDTLFEIALHAGAEDIIDEYAITCQVKDFHHVLNVMVSKLGDPESAALVWKPHTEIVVDEDQATTLLTFIDVLEGYDDVKAVFSNVAFPANLSDKDS